MSVFDTLKGGIIVLIKSNEEYNYYLGENSYWPIDDWNIEIESGVYLEQISGLKLDFDELNKGVLEIKGKKLPKLFIDLDSKSLISNYYDQALEDRVPASWSNSEFIREDEIFLERLPTKVKYW